MATVTRYQRQVPDALRQYRSGTAPRMGRRLNAVAGVPINAAPSGLVVTVSGLSYVLNWAAVLNAESYNIYRASSASGPYTLIGSSLMNTYTDSPTPGAYWYKVSAVDSLLGPVPGPGEGTLGGPAPTPGGGARRGLNQGTE